MSYKKSDMVYKDYKWTAVSDHDNPNIIGFPDNKLLNRSEGYEMLHFINSFGKKNSWDGSIASYQHLERIIRTEVPSNLHSHKNIVEWIQRNYTTI